LARLLADPTPAAGSPPTGDPVHPPASADPAPHLSTAARPAGPEATSGKAAPSTPSVATSPPAPPSSTTTIRSAILNLNPDTTALDTVYLNRQETLLSTALPRPEVRLAALTLQLQVGRYDAATGQFAADPQQPAVNVALGDGSDTLAGLHDAIRTGAPELGAAVVKDGTGYRLAVRLPEEAAAHTVAVRLGKASVSTATGEGQPLGFTVQRDADAVQKAVQSLVSAYNRLGSAAGSLPGNLQAQTLMDPLRQALVGAMNHPERLRTLAQAGVTVQPDGSLLIDPVRLQKAAEAHPRRLLDPFADLGGDDQEDDDSMPTVTDSFTDWLADLGDEKESWERPLEDQAQYPAFNPDGGRHPNSGLDAVAARCRARLATVDQVTRQILSSGARLNQVLARWAGESAASI
jgi:hypothetical protein